MSEKASFTTSIRPVHHYHKYVEPELLDGLLGRMSTVHIACFFDDCYEGMNREMYPPELIGPKLTLVHNLK